MTILALIGSAPKSLVARTPAARSCCAMSFGPGDEIVGGAECQDVDLFGREPEREIAGVMFDEETDETFVRAEMA